MNTFDAELCKEVMSLLNLIDENKDAYRRHIASVVTDQSDKVSRMMRDKYGEETNELRVAREEREKIDAMTPSAREWYFVHKEMQAVVDSYSLGTEVPYESIVAMRKYLKDHPEA